VQGVCTAISMHTAEVESCAAPIISATKEELDCEAHFDLCCVVGPVITKSNIFLQQLCKEKLSWDESLPESQNTEWSAICTSFGQIKHASFPQLVLSTNS